MSAETKAEVERWLENIGGPRGRYDTQPEQYRVAKACTRAIVSAIMHLADEIERITMERNR